MLSDRDRATLDQMALQLLSEDPQFVRLFVTRGHCLAGARRTAMNWRGLLFRLVWVSSGLSVMLLINGAAGPSLICVAVTVGLAIALSCGENDPRPPSI